MAVIEGLDVYDDVAGTDAYWAARNNSIWAAALLADKERALLEATQYLDATYDWIGDHPGDEAQVLGWPRLGAVDLEGRLVSGIPQRLQEATAELALEALGGRLLPSDDRGGDIKREKVGALEVEYLERAPAHPGYPLIDRMLRGLLRQGVNGASLVRV